MNPVEQSFPGVLIDRDGTLDEIPATRCFHPSNCRGAGERDARPIEADSSSSSDPQLGSAEERTVRSRAPALIHCGRLTRDGNGVFLVIGGGRGRGRAGSSSYQRRRRIPSARIIPAIGPDDTSRAPRGRARR